MSASPVLPPGLVRPALAGLTPYEPGRPISDVRRELGLESVVKLASNEGPFPPMPAALAAIRDAAEGVREYPDPGAWALRDALAAHLGVASAEVLPGAGIDGLIGLLARAVLDPGDELAMCWPSFVGWRGAAAAQGATLHAAPLAADGAYDLDALLAVVSARTKLTVVVSPNNPTGAAVDASDLADLLERLPDTTLPVVDEAYFEYLPSGGHDAIAHFRAGRPIAVLRTFSKAYGLAGLRVGYLVGPAELVSALARVRNAFDVTTPAQSAAVASLADGPGHLPGRMALNAAEREAQDRALRELGLRPWPSTANFLLADVGSEERAAAVASALLARGVIVRPARAFGVPSALRITIGWPEQNARLREALGAALREVPSPRA